jgi:hypothetical protein
MSCYQNAKFSLMGLECKYNYVMNYCSSVIESVMYEAQSWMMNKDIHRKFLVNEMSV